jgi:hypothetical protein
MQLLFTDATDFMIKGRKPATASCLWVVWATGESSAGVPPVTDVQDARATKEKRAQPAPFKMEAS